MTASLTVVDHGRSIPTAYDPTEGAWFVEAGDLGWPPGYFPTEVRVLFTWGSEEPGPETLAIRPGRFEHGELVSVPYESRLGSIVLEVIND